VLAVLTLQTKDGRDPSLIPSALLGKPAPAVGLPAVAEDIPGGFAGADLRGRVTMVNVFASWCVPCLVEHPLITRLAEEGVAVYAINHRDTVREASRWLKKNGNPYTAVGFDPDGRASVEWGVTGVPETYIINAEGIVTFKHAGPITAKVLKDTILPKLEEAGE
jgi:cytochrome c biogenesis protein CcmG/thiol:disulfide interchange protein DsbE